MPDIDQAVQAAFNAQEIPGYDLFFSAITQIGSAYLWIAVLMIYLRIGRWKKVAAVLIIALVFGMIVNEDIKGIVQRIRPENVMIGGYFTFHSYSFPSGHTETAFIMATVLSAFVAWRYSLITYLLAAAVGMSRVYLGVHYFTDVVGGAIAGIIIGCLTILVLYRREMVRDNALVSKICQVMKIQTIGMPQRTDIIEGFVTLFFGLSTAMVLLLAGEYILSMATLLFIYVRLFSGTGRLDRAMACRCE